MTLKEVTKVGLEPHTMSKLIGFLCCKNTKCNVNKFDTEDKHCLTYSETLNQENCTTNFPWCITKML